MPVQVTTLKAAILRFLPEPHVEVGATAGGGGAHGDGVG
jgi:hypothetical protein